VPEILQILNRDQTYFLQKSLPIRQSLNQIGFFNAFSQRRMTWVHRCLSHGFKVQDRHSSRFEKAENNQRIQSNEQLQSKHRGLARQNGMAGVAGMTEVLEFLTKGP
jgi:hypothetical protein